MNFTKVDKYAQRSDCGRYSVAVVGAAGGFAQYAAWRTSAHEAGRLMLGLHQTPEAAREACEDDADA